MLGVSDPSILDAAEHAIECPLMMAIEKRHTARPGKIEAGGNENFIDLNEIDASTSGRYESAYRRFGREHGFERARIGIHGRRLGGEYACAHRLTFGSFFDVISGKFRQLDWSQYYVYERYCLTLRQLTIAGEQKKILAPFPDRGVFRKWRMRHRRAVR